MAYLCRLRAGKFFIFYLDAPKKVRTQRTQPRRQHGIKPAEPSKSNSTKTLKVSVKPFQRLVGIQRAKPVVVGHIWPLAESETPQRILTNKAKATVKPSKTNKSKSAMQLKKSWYNRCNASYNLNWPNNLHCANSNEQSKSNPFPNLRAQAEQIWKTQQN